MRQKIFLFIFLVPFLAFGQVEQREQRETQEGYFYTVIENQPEFPGGHEELTRYIQNYVIKATKEIEDLTSGTVWVQFWVEIDGSITEPIILRGLTPELDSISIELINSMPKWSPGTLRKEPIRVRFNLPVRFNSQAVKRDD